MSKFITNQNIEINLDLASLGDRILAFIIDALIILMYIIIGAFLIGIVEGEVAPVIVGGVLFTPLFFYSLLFEWFGNGQTPGKRFRNIRVIRSDGTAAGPAQYLLRWLLRPVDFGIYGSIAVLSIIVTKNAQRLGDLVAGTLVISDKTSSSLEDYTPIVAEATVQ
ncbi:MAG: RDD family protein, partial [Cyclobacteriaceae bacterium]